MNPEITVYCQNRPPLDQYQQSKSLVSLDPGELAYIVAETGNHWRKIFNVYAKLIYALSLQTKDAQVLSYASWQQYRDLELLQNGSRTELVFASSLDASTQAGDRRLHLIMGKTYAKQILATNQVRWLDDEFAVGSSMDLSTEHSGALIVCPYFDYRQLSDVKIDTLVDLVLQRFPDLEINPILQEL